MLLPTPERNSDISKDIGIQLHRLHESYQRNWAAVRVPSISL